MGDFSTECVGPRSPSVQRKIPMPSLVEDSDDESDITSTDSDLHSMTGTVDAELGGKPRKERQGLRVSWHADVVDPPSGTPPAKLRQGQKSKKTRMRATSLRNSTVVNANIPETISFTADPYDNTGNSVKAPIRGKSRVQCARAFKALIELTAQSEDPVISVMSALYDTHSYDPAKLAAKPNYSKSRLVSPFQPPNTNLDIANVFFGSGVQTQVHAYGLYDTGASVCLMSTELFNTPWFQALPIDIIPYTGLAVQNANKQRMFPTCVVAVEFTALGETHEWLFLVMPGLAEMVILGKDWQAYVQAVCASATPHSVVTCMRTPPNRITGVRQKFTLNAHRVPLNAKQNWAVVNYDSIIPPKTTRLVESTLQYSEKRALADGYRAIVLIVRSDQETNKRTFCHSESKRP